MAAALAARGAIVRNGKTGRDYPSMQAKSIVCSMCIRAGVAWMSRKSHGQRQCRDIKSWPVDHNRFAIKR